MARRFFPVLLVATVGAVTPASPLLAEEAQPSPYREGVDLLSEGTRLLLRGLASDLAPMMQQLRGMVDDVTAYHPPEVLPNGDIIIRRKVPLSPPPAEGETEL